MNLRIAASICIAGAALLLAFPERMFAQEPRVDRLEVVQSGFMTARKTGRTVESPGTATGYTVIAADPEFLADAPADTARVGTLFGARFRVVGQPSGANVTLRTVWKIPAPGITNPKTGNTYRENVSEVVVKIGEVRTRAYGFEEAWEIARGTWTFELWQGDRKLLEQSFTIQ